MKAPVNVRTNTSGAPPRPRRKRNSVRLAMAALGLGSVAPLGVIFSAPAGAATVGTFSLGTSLATARSSQTATLLDNGLVLIAGGLTGSGTLVPTASAELYNPSTGVSTATGSLGTARYGATASALPNGEVLIAGGVTGTGTSAAATSSVEIFNPTLGTFTSGPALPTAVFGASAVSLPNGSIVVIGGESGTAATPVPTNAVSIYSPSTGASTAAGTLANARAYASAAVLNNGSVLVTGGSGLGGTALGTSEIYSPSANSWAAVGSLGTARTRGSARLLPNGSVLVAGGQSTSGTALASAELFNATTNTWSATGNLITARSNLTLTVLVNGTVLAAGGSATDGTPIGTAETFNPGTGAWTATGPLSTARASATATATPGGFVLLAGGLGASNAALSSTESYDAGTLPGFTTASRLAVVSNVAATVPVDTSNTAVTSIAQVGPLPAGLTLNPSTNGNATITGTATAAPGTYHVQLYAEGSTGVLAQQRLTIVVEAKSAPGYLVALRSGTLYSYGDAPVVSQQLAVNPTSRPVIAVAVSPNGSGYYLVTALGNVYNEAGAPFFGSAASVKRKALITGFAVTPDGGGYWLVAENGTVYPYGDAVSYSSSNENVNRRPIVGIASTVDGKGYYLISALGNVYNEGDAVFFGSEARLRLPAPMSAIAVTPDGGGYDLTDQRGDVYNLGDAHSFGSQTGVKIPHPVAALALSLDGGGYFLATSGGNIYNYGDAGFSGSPVHQVKDGALVSSIAVTS